MRKKDIKKFWQEQRAKERKQLKPFAEKIVKAVVECSETIKQENKELTKAEEKEFIKEESVNREIDKLRSNFYYQLKMRGINIE